MIDQDNLTKIVKLLKEKEGKYHGSIIRNITTELSRNKEFMTLYAEIFAKDHTRLFNIAFYIGKLYAETFEVIKDDKSS